ncbi:MAG: 2-phospho-L-lactate transferase [Gammaproteobacteria bacterium]|nr:2-phospho-L-lactate transferase [Gammaproteobacteria bacterium]
MTILALTGGVGGAKLSLGLSHVLEPNEVTFVVNVGDDFEHMGLSISPDVDTLTYTLAAIVNESTGWGRADESWDCLSELENFEADTWFQLGDRDLALHLFRTALLKRGKTLTEVTQTICERLGVEYKIAPVTDSSLRTRVLTAQGSLAFQDYFVRLKCEPEVSAVEYHQRTLASLSPAINTDEITGVVICPSNPFLSIDPILEVDELRSLLINRDFPVVAVSPIVGDRAIKGPTAKMMRELKMPVTCVGVAQHYIELMDGYVIDDADAHQMREIEELGIRVRNAPSIMRSLEDKVALARVCVDFLKELR